MDTSVAVEIKPKMHFTGTVTKVSLAGAVVDIGAGQPAVLHISQIVPAGEGEAVKRVEDVLQIGQPVEVWVRRVREDHIELSMFRPLELEWREIKEGMTVKGKVVRLEKFGAFVEIGAERPGLIHISEMAHGYVRTPGEVVKEGDEVEAQVLEVNRRKKQIKLSMKVLLPEPEVVEPPARPAREERPAGTPGEKPRRSAPKKGSRKPRSESQAETYAVESSSAEPDPTAMEIALRQAMDKARTRKQDDRLKRAKAVSQEQEEILSRTLENKVKTG